MRAIVQTPSSQASIVLVVQPDMVIAVVVGGMGLAAFPAIAAATDYLSHQVPFAYTVTFGNPEASVTQSKQLTRLVFRAPGTVCQ